MKELQRRGLSAQHMLPQPPTLPSSKQSAKTLSDLPAELMGKVVGYLNTDSLTISNRNGPGVVENPPSNLLIGEWRSKMPQSALGAFFDTTHSIDFDLSLRCDQLGALECALAFGYMISEKDEQEGGFIQIEVMFTNMPRAPLWSLSRWFAIFAHPGLAFGRSVSVSIHYAMPAASYVRRWSGAVA